MFQTRIDPIADDDVIQYPDPQKFTGFHQPRGQKDVRMGRFRVSAGMIMNQSHRRRTASDRVMKHFPRRCAGRIQISHRYIFYTCDLIFCVEMDHLEDLFSRERIFSINNSTICSGLFTEICSFPDPMSSYLFCVKSMAPSVRAFSSSTNRSQGKPTTLS